MDLTNLENALNNGNFKEQVYYLEGVYQISKVLNQFDLLKNISEYDLEARLNTQLRRIVDSEKQKLNEAGNALKTQLISELNEAKDNHALKQPQIQGVTKFLGIYIYGRQTFFKNESDIFIELFELHGAALQANKSYLVQFSMPFELQTNGLYSDYMGEMVLCLKANSKVWPIINSFYQNKTTNLNNEEKNSDFYRATCIFETPSEQADYKIAVFARRHGNLWVNVNYTPNVEGFETSFLNNASFRNFTTQSIPTTYGNDWVFYKHSQAIVYEILK